MMLMMPRTLPLPISAHPGDPRSIVKPTGSVIGRYVGEILTVVALLAGWTFVTLAIARLARPDVVWPLSLGLLFMLIPGRPILSRFVGIGLYGLTKDPESL
jgi:hypothetical protein